MNLALEEGMKLFVKAINTKKINVWYEETPEVAVFHKVNGKLKILYWRCPHILRGGECIRCYRVLDYEDE